MSKGFIGFRSRKTGNNYRKLSGASARHRFFFSPGKLLGVFLAPVDLRHFICEEEFPIILFRKIPLIEPKVIVRFHEPMAHPLAGVRMVFREIAHAVF